MAVTEGNFLYTLTKIRHSLFSFLEAELKSHGITDVPPSYGHLLYILNRKGPLTLLDLARYAEKDKSTVSSVIKRLEKSGYVAKVRGKHDGRTVKIKLTPRAQRIKPRVWEISDAMNAKLFHGLTAEEKSRLFELIGKVRDNL